ncbi:efflux RND transporter periplasmic adaptor subunit [Agromyces sp. MMS24-JH15]|uniref:efflux RND transporter periplasmic adaptor subunit n=1 Tax=Agromyces sp. MMS24-JH15 TaxID=3243765 RepID=UPI0037495236
MDPADRSHPARRRHRGGARQAGVLPDRAPDDVPLVPTGTVAEPQVAVERGTIANDLALNGTVNADAPAAVKATATGAVDELFAAVGSQVAAGQKLYDIKVPDEVEPVEQTGPDGVPVVQVPKQTYHYAPVTAPIAGVLTALEVMPGQQVSVGQASGEVAPPTFNVTATISPEQQYRLTDAPTEATVTIAGGPAPFTCGGLVISTGAATAGGGADPTGAAGGGGSTSGTTVRCTVPGDVRVFVGLAAQVTISAGVADGVLVIPTTAVSGGAETGKVWLIRDGEQVEQAVRLGLTDGTSIEVVEGLAEGDLVLQFVPGAPAQAEQGCVAMGDGSLVCGAMR